MKKLPTIAVHARELEQERIDGTRVYMAAILNQWVRSNPPLSDRVTLCHSHKDFNPALDVPSLYQQRKLANWPLWTQSAFAWEVYKDAPDVLWMPVHNMPIVHSSHTRVVVTIHDLAFKRFPDHFPARDLRLHNLQTDYVARHADHLIAVSQSTKKDLLTYYPFLKEENITVIHHGIDLTEWRDANDVVHFESAKEEYDLCQPYMLYVGALQPRKNLVRLIKAFEQFRDRGNQCQLVLAGADAWLAQGIHEAAHSSSYSEDIIFTGGISHETKRTLLRHAQLMVYPSLYEGFGLPVLEAFATATPVVCADNSSLREIAQDGAQYCDALEVDSMADALHVVFTTSSLRAELVTRGEWRLLAFKWSRAADETLRVLEG